VNKRLNFILFYFTLTFFFCFYFYFLYFRFRQRSITALLSLTPPFCIVVLKRELANIFFSLNLSLLSNPLTHNNININMEIDTLRGWFNISNTNSSKELSVNSSTSSILYIERMLALNNSPF